MSSEVSRRTFLAGVPVAAAAQTVVVKRGDGPIRIVTMNEFEPHELRKITGAAKDAKVELVFCKSREEFREKLRDADVVYGDVRGAELDYAPRLKWVQSG